MAFVVESLHPRGYVGVRFSFNHATDARKDGWVGKVQARGAGVGAALYQGVDVLGREASVTARRPERADLAMVCPLAQRGFVDAEQRSCKAKR